jgi:hypothetical protein
MSRTQEFKISRLKHLWEVNNSRVPELLEDILEIATFQNPNIKAEQISIIEEFKNSWPWIVKYDGAANGATWTTMRCDRSVTLPRGDAMRWIGNNTLPKYDALRFWKVFRRCDAMRYTLGSVACNNLWVITRVCVLNLHLWSLTCTHTIRVICNFIDLSHPWITTQLIHIHGEMYREIHEVSTRCKRDLGKMSGPELCLWCRITVWQSL